LTRLQQEQRQYEAKAIQAKATLQAALAVLNIHVETLAEQIEIAERLSSELRVQLWSYSRLWIPGMASGPKPVHLSPRIVNLLHQPVEAVTEADASTVKMWRDVLDHLLSDPEYIIE
jgi:hypothetical protein